MPKTDSMTQRVELATVMDRLAIEELITDYAVCVDDGDWTAYRGLFSPDGRADYRRAGGIEGSAAEITEWLTRTMELFPMRQHLIVNRRLRFGRLDNDTGDTAEVQADYINPMRLAGDGAGSPSDAPSHTPPGAPDFVCGGRYAFSLVRTHSGWRLRGVTVHEKWRRTEGAAAATSP